LSGTFLEKIATLYTTNERTARMALGSGSGQYL
jgi:hypothetical protein